MPPKMTDRIKVLETQVANVVTDVGELPAL